MGEVCMCVSVCGHARQEDARDGYLLGRPSFATGQTEQPKTKNIYKRAGREGRVTETRVDDWTRTKKKYSSTIAEMTMSGDEV